MQYLVVDVLDACFSGAHVPTLEAQVAHARQGQLPQVALLHPAAHQRHGNVPLHTNATRFTQRQHIRGLPSLLPNTASAHTYDLLFSKLQSPSSSTMTAATLLLNISISKHALDLPDLCQLEGLVTKDSLHVEQLTRSSFECKMNSDILDDLKHWL